MSFDKFMDGWMDRPILGLPLSMGFLCSWHRIHATVIVVAFVPMVLSKPLASPLLRNIGFWAMMPSLACFALLPVLALSFLTISKLSSKWYRNGEPDAESDVPKAGRE